MTATNWYWIHGTTYCPACVECDTPAVDAAECARGPSGGVRCACCHATGEEIEAGRPWLHDYDTGEEIRHATDEEIEASRDAGDTGVILIDADGSILRSDDAGADEARRVYVQE